MVLFASWLPRSEEQLAGSEGPPTARGGAVSLDALANTRVESVDSTTASGERLGNEAQSTPGIPALLNSSTKGILLWATQRSMGFASNAAGDRSAAANTSGAKPRPPLSN